RFFVSGSKQMEIFSAEIFFPPTKTSFSDKSLVSPSKAIWEVISTFQFLSQVLSDSCEQYRTVGAVCQEAFAHLQDLKKQQREKNKYFFKYKDDSRTTNVM
ncbi:hypothetical protein EUTSA_v10027552mg, partial [Eutrema salsugineum]